MDIPYIFTDFLRFNKLNVRNRIQPISNTISKYFEVLGLLVHSVSMWSVMRWFPTGVLWAGSKGTVIYYNSSLIIKPILPSRGAAK